MQELDVTLPIFNLVQSDGTIYMKEYLVNSGQAQGLKIACDLNRDLCTKALIDNCGTTQKDMDDIVEGFASLDVLRSLVIRRSVIGPGIVPHIEAI